jgi:hypothetical protein
MPAPPRCSVFRVLVHTFADVSWWVRLGGVCARPGGGLGCGGWAVWVIRGRAGFGWRGCVGCSGLLCNGWELVVMGRVRFVGVVVLLVVVCGGVGASVAVAEEAPYWSIEGTRLAAGKTAEITFKATTNQEFEAAGIKVTCEAVAVEKGAVLLGSEPGEPGKNNETFRYTLCSVTGNGSPCAVENGELVSRPLTSELGYASNKKSLVVEFTPASGKKLAVWKFVGSGCKETETGLEGQLVAGVFTDAATPVLLELPNAVASAPSFLLKFVAAPKSKIFLIKGGTGTEVETAEIKAFGHEAIALGTLLVALVSGKSWSPLL